MNANNKSIQIREANPNDYHAVSVLLQAEKLPVADIEPSLPGFFIMEEDHQIVGAIALEKFGSYGLLRSMVVHANYRNHGIAATLVSEVESRAAAFNMLAVYLVTTTAENYFERKGYRKVDRKDLPLEILQSREFQDLCPASSAVMVKQMIR